MSEKKSGFMADLDVWSESNVIGVLAGVSLEDQDYEERVESVKLSIRKKVLESYRNGQAAGPAKKGSYARR